MHSKNPYAARYDLTRLAKAHSELQQHIVLNPKGEQTIDFSDALAVLALNKAMLIADFGLTDYTLPKGYLIPPVPGRLEYLLHVHDFLIAQFGVNETSQLHGFDLGAGANGIYCILGAQHFNFKMTGAESDAQAITIAKANLKHTKDLDKKIDYRHQENKSALLNGIIKPGETFDFMVCNPPFYSSKEEATRESLKKQQNLGYTTHAKDLALNFAGQANELWCNGGEALFIKRLIKESAQFKTQVRLFSSLVAKSQNLPKLKKQLQKTNANFEVNTMQLGNKKSRILCWWF